MKKEAAMRNPDEYLARLEELILASSLTKVEFLKHIGISKSTYYRWKDGKAPRAIDIYLAIDNYTENP